ncbi:MAG: amidase [Hyphomicrobiaceae bacterium]|nr:amidase [Hyphomicrobiaceae bacterium]
MSADTPTDRLEAALAAIDDPSGDGKKACLTVWREEARRDAQASTARLAAGTPLSPLDGRIVSIKDLFDIKGEITRAGSKAREEEPPAAADAEAVNRLRRAGAVLIARTNMTELAFSGIGLNPHFGTPGNAHDRSRVPGGSTSGGAISVAAGMAEIALGSDTGGSTRIPPAFNGLCGMKPTQARISRAGVHPLSWSLDTVGTIARNVADLAATDSVLSGEAESGAAILEAGALRLCRLDAVLGECDTEVVEAFEAALGRIRAAGAGITSRPDSWLIEDVRRMNASGGIAAVEAHAANAGLMRDHRGALDPNVSARIAKGAEIPAPDFAAALQTLARLRLESGGIFEACDAVVLPTVPMTAPRIADLADPRAFQNANMRALSLTLLANALDLPAISLPMASTGLPTGLMLFGRRGDDRRLLKMAAALEPLAAAR